MRKLMVLLLMPLCLSLSGCNSSGELENQAYVLILGVDRLPGGALELTARIPRVAGKGAQESDGSSGDSYMTFSAAGENYARAMEALQWVTPRRTNLSHIEMLVASRTIAEEAGFSRLVDQIAETPHLYITARFVVCEGTARDFIETQQAVIGTRLSADIEATLAHYAAFGYIPNSSFADVYYAGASVYSDPVAIMGYVKGADEPASALMRGDDDHGASAMHQRFAGAALFEGGRMVGTLDTVETQLLNLVLGETASLSVDCNGRAVELMLDSVPQKTVETGVAPRLTLALELLSANEDCGAYARETELLLVRSFEALIAKCQRLNADPFGFAEEAAGHFMTVPEWLAYDWQTHYSAAAVDVKVHIRCHGGS